MYQCEEIIKAADHYDFHVNMAMILIAMLIFIIVVPYQAVRLFLRRDKR
jgi:hypothetical protein